MLFVSILLFVVITIAEIVVPVTSLITPNQVGGIIGIVIAIICLVASIVCIVACAKRIKAADKRGKSIAGLVISIFSATESFSLVIVSIFCLIAKTAVVIA